MDKTPENNERIEKYLADVSIGLRYMSPEEMAETIDELRQHLYSLVAELQEEGEAESVAITKALKKFGPAHRARMRLGAGHSAHW